MKDAYGIWIGGGKNGLCWPVIAAMFDEEPPPLDPRTIAEDMITEWIDHHSEFELATMVQNLNARGWTLEKALHIRQREWRKERQP